MNILLVDECPEILDASHEFFEANGYNCFVAMSLTTAISAIDTIDIDVIISEYDFSGIRPFTFFKKSLKNNKSTKIIILTNFSMIKSDIKKLHALGIHAIFEKPITPKLLLETINNYKSKKLLSIFNTL